MASEPKDISDPINDAVHNNSGFVYTGANHNPVLDPVTIGQLQRGGVPGELEVAAVTNCGLKRTGNQDRFVDVLTPFGRLLLLADGMGGHRGGERAASLVVEQFPNYLSSQSSALLVDSIRRAAALTNRDIYREGHSGDKSVDDMGSTLVAAIFTGNSVSISHCGDSRAYLFRSGRLSRLTQDHTVGQRMLKAGILSAEQANEHPDAHLLTNTMGQSEDAEIEIASLLPLHRGDVILLCSDGLYGYVPEFAIESTLKEQCCMQATADRLVARALQGGGGDNVTVILAQAGETYPPARRMISPARLALPRSVTKLNSLLAAGVAGTLLGGLFLAGLLYMRPKPRSADAELLMPPAALPQSVTTAPAQSQTPAPRPAPRASAIAEPFSVPCEIYLAEEAANLPGGAQRWLDHLNEEYRKAHVFYPTSLSNPSKRSAWAALAAHGTAMVVRKVAVDIKGLSEVQASLVKAGLEPRIVEWPETEESDLPRGWAQADIVIVFDKPAAGAASRGNK